ncbi:MAG: dinitrogenase iron-molybdenum cofactor [Proteobacteria bacterium]|nr:dinitrogenase iron-molybdenum cofactor [Pseudomonadota bacterium]
MAKRVAVSIRRKGGVDLPIDSKFGRAPAFVVFDLESREVISEFENEFVNDAQGAGIGAAARMFKEGVDAVISGRFGPKAYEALAELGIEMWFAPDWITAGEAIARLKSGELEQMRIKVY